MTKRGKKQTTASKGAEKEKTGTETQKKLAPKFDFDAEIGEVYKWYERGIELQKEFIKYSHMPVAAGLANAFSKWLKAFRDPANDVFRSYKLEKGRASAPLR